MVYFDDEGDGSCEIQYACHEMINHLLKISIKGYNLIDFTSFRHYNTYVYGFADNCTSAEGN